MGDCYDIYNTKVMFTVESEHICTNHFPWLCWDVMMYYLVLQLCLLECKTCSAIVNVLLNVIIYINPRNWFGCQELGFSVPMCLMWSWSSACVFRTSSITIHLPFNMIPSITAMSSQNVQYILMSYSIWSLFSGQPTIMYPFIYCKCSSCVVACCKHGIDMHSGIFVAVCIVSTFISMPGIFASLFSEWLCLESQSAMKRSGPCLYNILTWNWCILRKIYCILYDSVATSFLNNATTGLWLVIILTFLAKQ